MYRKFPHLGETDCSLPKLVQPSRVSLRNTLRGNPKRASRTQQTPSFFPSAQMKNKRYKPNVPTETRAIPARTQSTQTSHRSGDERPAPELHKLYWYKPAAAIINPPQAVNHASVVPWRGVGEVERDSQIRTITLVIVALSL